MDSPLATTFPSGSSAVDNRFGEDISAINSQEKRFGHLMRFLPEHIKLGNDCIRNGTIWCSRAIMLGECKGCNLFRYS